MAIIIILHAIRVNEYINRCSTPGSPSVTIISQGFNFHDPITKFNRNNNHNNNNNILVLHDIRRFLRRRNNCFGRMCVRTVRHRTIVLVRFVKRVLAKWAANAHLVPSKIASVFANKVTVYASVFQQETSIVCVRLAESSVLYFNRCTDTREHNFLLYFILYTSSSYSLTTLPKFVVSLLDGPWFFPRDRFIGQPSNVSVSIIVVLDDGPQSCLFFTFLLCVQTTQLVVPSCSSSHLSIFLRFPRFFIYPNHLVNIGSYIVLSVFILQFSRFLWNSYPLILL